MAAPSFTVPKKSLPWFTTGSSPGFGLSLTCIDLKAGHNFIATSRNPSATPYLVKEVESAGGQWSRLEFGVIVNFSSGAALQGNGTMGAYAGAKAGLDGFMKIARERGRSVQYPCFDDRAWYFNTNMSDAPVVIKDELPEDYVGTMSDNTIKDIKSGKITINSDKDKAITAVFELVTGTGFGAGNEAEILLPLGTDMTVRVKEEVDSYQNSLDIFGEVTNNVTIDR